MKTLYLIRHCKASGQEPSATLTVEGIRQSLKLSEFLSVYPIEKIFSSTYKRAIDSIKPYAEKVGLEIETDERLGERIITMGDYPNWLSFLEASFDDFSLALEGGESSNEVTDRINSFLNDIKKLNEEHIVIISHGNLLTLFLKLFDPSYGFAEWKVMTNPDVYKVQLQTSKVSRVWKTHQ